jgi:glycosyltransferase involved in cell wall biosynthesis
MPKVSIIIPLHNAEQWINKTLESARDQSWKDTEIIVVENGSTDRSFEIAKRFKSPKLTVVSIPQTTAAAARNHGLNLATGDYIQFLDADDLLSSDKIESQLQLLSGHPEDCLVSCGWAKFTEDPENAIFRPQEVWGDFDPVTWLLKSLTGGGMMQTACWLTPRRLIDQAGAWDEKLTLHDDGEFFSRVMLQSKKIIFDPNAKVYYRQVQSSLSRQNTSFNAAESALQVALSYKRSLLKCDNSTQEKIALAHVFKSFIYANHPHHTPLLDLATNELDSLKLHVEPHVGGMNFIKLSRLFGFRKALVIRQRLRTLVNSIHKIK